MQLDPRLLEILACPPVPRAAACRRGGAASWSALGAPAGWPTRCATTSRCCSIDEARRPRAGMSHAPGAGRRGPRRPVPALEAGWTRPRCCAPSPRPARRSARRCCASRTTRSRRSPPTAARARCVVTGMGGVGHRGRRRRGGRRPRLPGARARLPRATGCPAGSARWTSSSPCPARARPRRRSPASTRRCAAAARLVTVGAGRLAAWRAQCQVAAALHLAVDARGPDAAGEPVGPRRPGAAGRSTPSGWPHVPRAVCSPRVADQLDARRRAVRPGGGQRRQPGQAAGAAAGRARCRTSGGRASWPRSRPPGSPPSSPRTRSTPPCTAPLTEVHHNQVVVAGRPLRRPAPATTTTSSATAVDGRAGAAPADAGAAAARHRGGRPRSRRCAEATLRVAEQYGVPVDELARRRASTRCTAGQPGRPAGLRERLPRRCCRASTPSPDRARSSALKARHGRRRHR